MFDHTRAARYLLDHGLIAGKSVVNGDLRVVDCSRRNRNVKVISDQGPSYLLKQGVGPDGHTSVAHESRVYRFLHAGPASRRIGRYLPRLHLYDNVERVLVLELLDDSQAPAGVSHPSRVVPGRDRDGAGTRVERLAP